MGFDKPIIQTSNPNKKEYASIVRNRTIFYGEVISITDDSDGGRIKVKIPELDNQTANNHLPWAYPLLPKFFHVYPQVGEMVRILIEDNKFPERSRFWIGSIISQPQKIGFDSKFTALSTTNLGLTRPEKAPSTYPDAEGVFPLKSDIAIVGKVNTDVILRVNEVHIRAGKHENNNILKLNTENPASINMVFEPTEENNDNYYSNTVIQSDKIAIISHDGIPNFKAAKLSSEDRKRIFEQGHPMARADVLVEALEIIRLALINHIHGYSGISADKNDIINKLESIQFEQIMQNNIVIN
jgi:hypothetical protein